MKEDIEYVQSPAPHSVVKLHYAFEPLNLEEVSIDLDMVQDDAPVRGNAISSGDADVDKEYEDGILRRLDNGDAWAWALVRVTLRWHNFEASTVLGGCSYESEQSFMEDTYYSEMCAEALGELNATVRMSCKDILDRMSLSVQMGVRDPIALGEVKWEKEVLIASSCLM